MWRIPLDEVVHFDVCTHSPATGGISDADATPTFSVFEEATDTPIIADSSFTKRTSLTGNYRGSFTASAANGFEVGKWYNVVASATVGSVAGKSVAMTFMLTPAESSAGVPKTDVSHWLGTAAATPTVAGVPEVDVTHWIGTAAATPTVAGVPEVDITHYLGTAAQGASGRPQVDVELWLGSAPNALISGRVDITIGAVQTGALTAAGFSAGAIDAAALAADAGTEIGTAVWATAARTLTALDEDSTTLDLDATIRAAVGLASANLDTQLDALPTAAENATAVWGAAARTLTAFDEDSTTIDFDAAIRAAVGLASANLDTQIGDLPTNSELATALAAADDAVLAQVALVKNKTDNLPSDPADASDIAALFDALPTAVENATAVRTELGTELGRIDATISSRLADADYSVPFIADEIEARELTLTSDYDAAKTAAQAGDAMTLTGAYDFAKGTVAMTEAYAANGVAPTPVQAMFAIHQMLMQHAISGTTWNAYKLNNVDVAFAVTLDDGTNPTSARRT